MRHLALLLLFGALLTAPPSRANSDLGAIRAAYIYNFAKYTQWPDESRGELRLCVLGNDQPDAHIESYHGKPVRSQKLAVRQNVIMQDIPNCDIIFLPASAGRSVERARQLISNYPILFISEGADTVPKGAMIALTPTENRLVFDIDQSAAKQLGLKISSQVLRLARTVY